MDGACGSRWRESRESSYAIAKVLVKPKDRVTSTGERCFRSRSNGSISARSKRPRRKTYPKERGGDKRPTNLDRKASSAPVDWRRRWKRTGVRILKPGKKVTTTSIKLFCNEPWRRLFRGLEWSKRRMSYVKAFVCNSSSRERL